MEIYNLKKEDELNFVNYLKIWHADHGLDCEVKVALVRFENNEINIEDLLNTWLDVDGDIESLDMFLEEQR